MKQRTCGTHDGTFHADEVTALALLLLFDLIDEDKIVRTRDLSVLNECEFVCDVGGIYNPEKKRFDHHQSEYDGPLSSAGMVLEYLMDTQSISEDLYRFFNHSLILGVDAIDNGQITPQLGHCSFSGVIANFVPVRYDSGDDVVNRAFFHALHFSKNHLKQLQERFHYINECASYVEKAMKEGKHLLTFDRSMPWMESFFNLGGEEHPALFLIMPAGDHWKLRGIPPSMRDKMRVRRPLPKEWAGLLDTDLEKVSGIDGALFCHKGRFISVWKTKEGALKAYEKVIAQ